MKETVRDIKAVEDIPEVIVQNVKTDKGSDTNYILVVEKDSDNDVGSGTKQYQVVQNKDVYNAVSELHDYRIHKARVYMGGRKMFIEMTRANEIPIEVLPKDWVIPMVRILNSYNCTTSVSVSSFGIRKVCANGMVAPTNKRWVSSKIHVGDNVDFGHLKESVVEGMQQWDKAMNNIAKANVKKVDSEVALFYTDIPNKYRMILKENLKKKDSIYNIWNEITRFTTHDIGDKIQVPFEYERKANKVFKLLNATEKDMDKIARQLKEWNKRNIKK